MALTLRIVPYDRLRPGRNARVSVRPDVFAGTRRGDLHDVTRPRIHQRDRLALDNSEGRRTFKRAEIDPALPRPIQQVSTLDVAVRSPLRGALQPRQVLGNARRPRGDHASEHDAAAQRPP